jgi:hypothetical protein
MCGYPDGDNPGDDGENPIIDNSETDRTAASNDKLGRRQVFGV